MRLLAGGKSAAYLAYVRKWLLTVIQACKKSEVIEGIFRQTRSGVRSILGAPPPENVRKNCIKRDFTRHKKRAIAQHTKAYVSKWLSIVTQ